MGFSIDFSAAVIYVFLEIDPSQGGAHCPLEDVEMMVGTVVTSGVMRG